MKIYAPLSESIQKEYSKLVKIISNVPVKYRELKEIEGTGGKVSVSDIIAYQIGWGKFLIRCYETGLKNEMPDMPGEGFNKWDYVGLANHFYIKYHYDGLEKQDQEFYRVEQKIIEIVEKEHAAEHLDKIGIWDWCTLPSGKQWSLDKFIRVNSLAPYKRAYHMINKFVKMLK